MKKFIRELIWFTLIPGVITLTLLSTYMYFDPFKVVNKYDSYFVSGKPLNVILNSDYVSIETFLRNYPIFKYNSFIIGNSRSRFYEVNTWGKYIHSDNCFHFDASSETLYGISKKIEFLHKKNVQISNILITMDYSTLAGVRNSEGHLYIKHPILSGQSNLNFQLEFFKAYSNFGFFRAYLDFKLSGTIKEYMKAGNYLDDTQLEYDVKSNELKWRIFEDIIKTDPSKFYNKKKMDIFYFRDTVEKFSPVVIKKEQLMMLNNICDIFKMHNTNFKIVVNPLYDQIKLNKRDLDVLNMIFGADNVFDFSGINSITSDYHNYYEQSHYRPHIANEIMKRVYDYSQSKSHTDD